MKKIIMVTIESDSGIFDASDELSVEEAIKEAVENEGYEVVEVEFKDELEGWEALK